VRRKEARLGHQGHRDTLETMVCQKRAALDSAFPAENAKIVKMNGLSEGRYNGC
jgi:hypothetical protein